MGTSQRHRRGLVYLAVVLAFEIGLADRQLEAGPPRELKLDVEFDDFNKLCDSQTARGYRLIDVAIYKVGTRDLYSGIWEQRADPVQHLRHGQTRADLERSIKEVSDANKYMLVYLEGKGGGGREKYAALWEPCTTEFPQVWVGFGPEEFKAKHNDLQAQKLTMTNLTVFEVDGQVICAGIWRKDELAETAVQINLTSAQFKLALKQKPAEGFRLSKLCAYLVQGKDLYSCLWTKDEGPTQEIRAALPAAGIKRLNVQMEKENMQPVQVEVFMVGNQQRYTIVYEDNK